MPIVAMDTNNPLGRRPFSAMGEMGDTWDLREQERSWIVRDTESAPVEHMRLPPELLRGVPGAVFLYRPLPPPSTLGALAPVNELRVVAAGVTPALPYTDCAGNPSARPGLCAERSQINLPTAPLPAAQIPPMQQVVPPGAAVIPVIWSSLPSTQTVVPLATAQPPSYSSIVASGQPATSAVPVTTSAPSWFTDPTQEVIAGFPNWGLLAAATVLAMMMKKGKR